MNTSSPHFTPALEKQAARWAARLDGSVLSARDRIALDAWLAASPVHRDLLSRYCQFSADLEQQLPPLVAAGAVTLPVPAPRRSAWLKWAAVATLAAAAAVVVALTLPVAPRQSQFNTIATPAAQRQALTLVDGTRVELNAHTSLQIALTPTERRVRLTDGEAFFAVSKDPARPFIVETPAGTVRVTGTQFNVRAETARPFEVTVVEGSVQVRPGNLADHGETPITLTAGDRLAAGAQGVAVQALTGPALDDALAWRHGQIVFAGTPLSEALGRFARYHGRGITATPAAAALTLGGRYSLDDLDGFFSSLEEVLDVRVTRNLSGLVQVSMRDEH